MAISSKTLEWSEGKGGAARELPPLLVGGEGEKGWWWKGRSTWTVSETRPVRPHSPCTYLRMFFVSHRVISKSFCRSQFPHKSVNSSFTITDIKNKLTDLCGN